jgi:hypothetical protein
MFRAWVNYLIKERKKEKDNVSKYIPENSPRPVRKLDLAYNFVNKYEIIYAKRTYTDFEVVKLQCH